MTAEKWFADHGLSLAVPAKLTLNDVRELLELGRKQGLTEARADSPHVMRAIAAYYLVEKAKELLNPDQMQKRLKWRCRRCGEDVDTKTMSCRCATSPSPWELVDE